MKCEQGPKLVDQEPRIRSTRGRMLPATADRDGFEQGSSGKIGREKPAPRNPRMTAVSSLVVGPTLTSSSRLAIPSSGRQGLGIANVDS